MRQKYTSGCVGILILLLCLCGCGKAEERADRLTSMWKDEQTETILATEEAALTSDTEDMLKQTDLEEMRQAKEAEKMF